MPSIDRLMHRVRMRPRDLRIIGVSMGPGGFTGLRIGLSTAAVMADTLGLRLLGVPSALVAAASTDAPPGEALVALASKGETTWLTVVERSGLGWGVRATPGLVDESWAGWGRYQTLVADEYLPKTLAERCRHDGVTILRPTFDAKACLEVAVEMDRRGEHTKPIQLRPLYPRQPEAVSLWERRNP